MAQNDLFKFVSLRPPEQGESPAEGSPIARRMRDVRERHAEVLPTLDNVASTERSKRSVAIKRRQAELARLVAAHEGLQRVIHEVSVHAAESAETRAEESFSPSETRTAERRAPTARSAAIPTWEAMEQLVEAQLSDESQRAALRTVLERMPRGREVSSEALIDALTINPFVEEANALCSELRALEESDLKGLPTAPASTATPEHPIVSAIGWGDLVVARESLVGYEAREIAHIENIMPGETKLREHERIDTTEQVEEIETITEKESEKDSQTTDRYELQAETQATIQQSFSIQAGVNTSGRYGLTKVDTSLDTSFQQNSSQSQSSSIAVAREVVSRAVERTFERVRKLRRLTITQQIRELNRHKLANDPGGGDTPVDLSGVYLWVEKIHRVELRQYGTRLMIEFHIPEPAVSLLERRTRTESRKRLPPFDVSPHDVTWGSYLCLAERYGATDVQPPPPMYLKVGYTWASAPSEEGEEYSEDTVADKIAIPDGYRPVSGTAIASALNASTELDFFLAVGGVTVIDQPGQVYSRKIFSLPVGGENWPSGVPVSARVHGHFDKTMALQVIVRCERMIEAYTQWQLRTWEAVRAGHEGLKRQSAMEEEQQALSRELLMDLVERSADENRRIERQELQKWATKAMRLKPQNFNAIEQVGEFQEVNPINADMQAPIVRMFEDAFEWDQMTYFLNPYFWARRESWALRMGVDAIDARLKAFLEAGAARVIVPVTPGFEAKVLAYLESDPNDDELTRISALPPISAPPDSPFESVWAEILTDRKADVALGSGTLEVENGNTLVHINTDSHWSVADRDIGRELYISGERFVVGSFVDDRNFHLDRPYPGSTDDHAVYAAGSVPFGPPWTINIPTSLIVLAGNRSAVADLG